jgi:hypothetical protein
MRHSSPVTLDIFSLTHLFHQVDQPKEIVEAKMASASGDHDERIRRRPIRPVDRNGAQAPGRVMEIQPLPAPAVPLHHELELLRP